jgi:hypothetical protein
MAFYFQVWQLLSSSSPEFATNQLDFQVVAVEDLPCSTTLHLTGTSGSPKFEPKYFFLTSGQLQEEREEIDRY